LATKKKATAFTNIAVLKELNRTLDEKYGIDIDDSQLSIYYLRNLSVIYFKITKSSSTKRNPYIGFPT
jgi:hypothetical protein